MYWMVYLCKCTFIDVPRYLILGRDLTHQRWENVYFFKCIGFTVYSNSAILKKLLFVDLQENQQYVNFLCGSDLKSRNTMCSDVPSEI